MQKPSCPGWNLDPTRSSLPSPPSALGRRCFRSSDFFSPFSRKSLCQHHLLVCLLFLHFPFNAPYTLMNFSQRLNLSTLQSQAVQRCFLPLSQPFPFAPSPNLSRTSHRSTSKVIVRGVTLSQCGFSSTLDVRMWLNLFFCPKIKLMKRNFIFPVRKTKLFKWSYNELISHIAVILFQLQRSNLCPC